MKTLYKRDQNGKVLAWRITQNINNDIVITYGRVNGTLIQSITPVIPKGKRSKYEQLKLEQASKFNHKLKEGYKEVDINKYGFKGEALVDYLTMLLPKAATDANNNTKPQKAVLYKEGKTYEDAGGQTKINGWRCTIGLEERTLGNKMANINQGNLFVAAQTSSKRIVIRGKEGNEFVLPHITAAFTEDMFTYNGIDIVFDGELYIPGKSLNRIQASIPSINEHGTLSKPSGNPKEVELWCYDLKVESITNANRDIIRNEILKDVHQSIPCDHYLDVERNKSGKIEPIVNIPTHKITDDEVISCTAKYISYGFEGVIIRNMQSEYYGGKSIKVMMKSKAVYDKEFLIIDIIEKPKEDTALFVLRNDINDETFECNPFGSYDERKEYLDNKTKYIGKWAKVLFRERSGVKEVPFHANVECVRELDKPNES